MGEPAIGGGEFTFLPESGQMVDGRSGLTVTCYYCEEPVRHALPTFCTRCKCKLTKMVRDVTGLDLTKLVEGNVLQLTLYRASSQMALAV